MKKVAALMLLSACSVGLAAADEVQSRAAAARPVVKEFAGVMKEAMSKAMKEGGPVNAIEVCSKQAPHIAHEHSVKSGFEIARTTLKARNPSHEPDAWEKKVLQSFEERKAKGEEVEKMEYAEVVTENGKQVFRYMKPIPTGEVCLKCHGTEIDPAVKTKLDGLYPTDKARGYKMGDIRGAFSLKQPM